MVVVVIVYYLDINLITQPIRQIADSFNSIQRGLIGADRVFKILDEDQSLPDDGKDEIKEVKGEIEFDDVRFSYVEGSEVLKGVSFHAKPGETIAIVGATGDRKSTRLNSSN